MGTRGPVSKRERSYKPAHRLRPSAAAMPEVVTEFRRIARAAPWLEAADGPLVEQLAEALVLQQTAYKLLMPNKMLVVDRTHGGDVRRNPALISWRTAAEVARAAAAKLALSPMDRARLGLEEESQEKTLAEVLFEEVVHRDN